MDWTQAAREATSDYLERLRELVAIDSGTDHKAGADAVGQHLAAELEALGCRVTRHRLEEYGDCFEAILDGQGEGHIFLIGHTDTVYPTGTAAERPLQVREGKAFGPGAADMKGGLLLGVSALRVLRAVGYRGFGRITFFLNSEEEIGSPVSRELYGRSARQADVALVLEPGREGGQIVSARKGVGRVELRARGKAAHAGVNPQDGASAIQALVTLLFQLYAMAEHTRGASFNVGVIQGGTRSNVVADQARAEIDIRVEDLAAWQRAQAVLRQISALETLPGVELETEGGLNNPPMPLTPAGELLVRLAQEEGQALGLKLSHITSGGGSDANYIAAQGTPCLDGLGPQGGGLHSPEEYILLESIVPRAALVARLIRRLVEELPEVRRLAS